MSDSSSSIQDQSDWDNKELIWDRKAFYVIKTPTIFDLPVGLEQNIKKAFRLAREEGYQIPSHPIILMRSGLFYGEVLVEISGIVTPGGNIRIFNDVSVYTTRPGKSRKELKKNARKLLRKLRKEGKKFTHIYYWYQMPSYCNKSTLQIGLLALGA
ncbi:hypothetical protein BBF96_08435 [Anoxybacter fermentans]|uniref:Uncharacterized protein n=1 Tax=Anoxybacter fermentans TaxID=1323375 RepID=A0A3S9SYK2_9FIRM|nr:hydrolase [Anoxybacter fermentans]AZR73407.1 hypothetical protein BBF96_08435 [Anoxybacter fermentans]